MSELSGVLALDKPAGPTSFDLVQAVRRAVHVRRVGHAGTLDPFATGLLVVCIGDATKAVPYLMDGEKTYEATITLGAETDTCDGTGQVTEEAPFADVTLVALERAALAMTGDVDQLPPVYSAIKKDGRRLYDYARKGEEVEVEPRRVLISALSVLDFDGQRARLLVRCGKGTYVRSIARDLARAVGTRGHLEALRRLAVGSVRVEDAMPLDATLTLDPAAVLARLYPVAEALGHLPEVRLLGEVAWRLSNGQRVAAEDRADGFVRVYDGHGTLIAVGEVTGGTLRVARGFAQPERDDGPHGSASISD